MMKWKKMMTWHGNINSIHCNIWHSSILKFNIRHIELHNSYSKTITKSVDTTLNAKIMYVRYTSRQCKISEMAADTTIQPRRKANKTDSMNRALAFILAFGPRGPYKKRGSADPTLSQSTSCFSLDAVVRLLWEGLTVSGTDPRPLEEPYSIWRRGNSMWWDGVYELVIMVRYHTNIEEKTSHRIKN